jgi:hypothetical protein
VISRELTKKYGLCQGGETPKAEKSPADFWAPLRIQVREAVAKCADFCELSNVLNDMGIELRIVERGKRKGLSFRKGKHKIPGYKLDRGLTYAKISEKLTINKSARLAEEQAKRSAIEREKERQKTVMKALNMESIKQYLLNSDLQEFLDKIMSFYDFPAWHYHLVPYEMVEHNDGIRLVLYTDGLMRDIERGIERNTDSLPQDTGESYIDFYCNEDGDIKAQVEFDPMNSHTAGLSGTINPSGGDIMITVRDYVGTKESHEQKMRQTPSTGTQIEEEVVWESQNDRSRIVDKAGEFILQKGVQGNVVGGKPSWEWEDEDYFKEFDVLKSDDTYDYLIIKKHDGEIKYINQLGYSLNTKQLSQLGVTSGKGMGGPS